MEVRYKDILDNIYDGVYFVDTERRITYWNKAAERITGYAAADVIGTRCADNILMHVDGHGKNLCLSGCPLAETVRDGKLREAEVFLHHKSGMRLPVRVRISPLRDDAGVIIGAVELFADNSNMVAFRERLRELEYFALIDPLTRVANRRAVEMYLYQQIEEIKRYGLQAGLLFMDIDDFKAVNDTYGHTTGDAVLSMVAQTIAGNVRPFDIVGRWGGEEFIGILRNVDACSLIESGNRLCMLVGESFLDTDSCSVRVTLSGGATQLLPDDTVERALHRADLLLYESKKRGKNRFTSDCTPCGPQTTEQHDSRVEAATLSLPEHPDRSI